MIDGPISDREKYFVTFFKDQSGYYLNEYRHQHAGSKWSFNIGSFFFGAFWFIYRKMYPHALGFFVLSIISSQIQLYVFTQYEINFEVKKVATPIVPLFWALVSGFTGNYFYSRFATTKVDAVLEKYPAEEQRMAALSEQGGTTNRAFLVAALLILFYLVIAGKS